MPEPQRKSKQQQLKDDYRYVFGSEAGKRVLDDLIRFTGLLAKVDNASMATPQSLGYTEGLRETGLYIFNQMSKPRERNQAIQEEYQDLISMGG